MNKFKRNSTKMETKKPLKKDSTSTRIPRAETMNTNTRIPVPGSLRIQQNHIAPPVGIMQPTKIISTTKIARPSSLSGIRPPISTIASLKKSLTGEKFSEAANLVSQKTTTVVKKFLTKPEKSEKNIETKAIIEKKTHDRTVNLDKLEKGSKETANEKKSSETTLNEKRSTLTRSETFVRENDDNESNANADVTQNILTTTYNECDQSMLHGNTTKFINKTQRYSLFEIPKDLVQSTPRPGYTFKNSNQPNIINNSPSHRMQLNEPRRISNIINATQTVEKPNNDTFLTKTCENTFPNETKIITPNNATKSITRSETFSQETESNNEIIPDQTFSNKTEQNEWLSEISNPCLDATLTIANQTLDNSDEDCLDGTILIASNSNENSLNKTLVIDKNIPPMPDKKDMKLQLKSTTQNITTTTTINDKLIDLTISPRLLNITKGVGNSPQYDLKHQTALLYMSPQVELRHSILTPRKASSRTSLAKTPDDILDPMDIDQYGNVFEIPQNVKQALSMNALQELKQTNKPRFSFGLDLTESTLDCSIELCDVSLASNAASTSTGANNQNSSGAGILQSPGTLLKKQNSFDLDESLGILTPDQMKEFLDSTTTNNTNNLDLSGLMAHHSSTGGVGNLSSGKIGTKLSIHQMRVDLTPSPEELPLDPVDVKTDLDIIMSLPPHSCQNSNSSSMTQSQVLPTSNTITYTELSQTDTDSKTDQMTKSNTSKVSTSFITSITSITSLDNGYQGDGEMSRPASRGGDHSPSNGPRNRVQIARQPSFNNQHQNVQVRRQDPMTDSDFFTESDADVDIFHRGDRRAQVIDGQLYGPMHQQPTASVFISEQPEMEDSCMESSGIFTDVENRCDDDLASIRRDAIEQNAAKASDPPVSNTSPNSLVNSVNASASGEIDMSPDGSTDTVKSNKNNEQNSNSQNRYNRTNSSDRSITPSSLLSQGQYYNANSENNSINLLTDSQTSSTINSSFSSDRISIDYQQLKSTTTSLTTTATTATTTTNIKRKSYTVRSSPTSNATSPTVQQTKSITEKRAATSPLLSAAKIKALSTTATNDYCGNRNINVELPQKTLIFKNSLKSISSSSSVASVKKTSPSRKHVYATSSSVRPSSSSLLSSSSTTNTFVNKNNNKNNSGGFKSNKTVNSNNRKKLTLRLSGGNNINSDLTNSVDCHQQRSPNSIITSETVLSDINQSNTMVVNTKPNNINGIGGRYPKNTVSKRNQNEIRTNGTANSSNNSSSMSISTGSGNNENILTVSPKNGGYRNSKFPPNKWDAVMNKIAENKNQQSKLINITKKVNNNQVKSKVSSGLVNGKNFEKIHDRKVINNKNQSNIKENQINNINSECSIENNLLCNENSNDIENGALIKNLQNENLIKINKNDIKKITRKFINCNNSSGKNSPNSSFDCTQSAHSSGITSPQTKRLLQGAIKRGRSYSKDSQQSSQSDLSLSGGSPKIIVKNVARSAKKRDVRNLSISPTDLGPPPKTQTPVTTPNGINRTKIISTNSAQKRISPIHSPVNLTQLNNSKSSPPPKKQTPRRNLDSKVLNKTPLKEHNRLIGQQQQQQNANTKNVNSTINGHFNASNRIKDSTVIVAANTPLALCNGNSPTTGTKLRNGNVNSASTGTPNSSGHGSPNNLQKKHLQSQQQHQPGQQNKNQATTQIYQKQQQQQRQQHQQQQQQQQQHQQQQQQQQQHKQQINETQNSCKTSLLDLSIPEGNKSVEALGVLLQYLVYDLDAFACPSVKHNYDETKKNLLQTQSLLDDARTACHDLQDQLIDKDNYYMTREQELQALHRCELTKVETSLIDFQKNANERVSSLEADLTRKDEEYKQKIELLQQQSDQKIQQLEKELEKCQINEIELQKQIEKLTESEADLRDRLQNNEDSFTERLQASVQREHELNEKITFLTRQLESTRLAAEKRERELEEKFNLSQNELTIVKNNQSFLVSQCEDMLSHNDEIKTRSPKNNGFGGAITIPNSNSSNIGMSCSMSACNSSNRVQMLENEVESLRSVMDIKLNDICELRKKNQELMRANEEYEALKIKYHGMESRLEDLQIQLKAKDEEKQELLSRMKHLQDTCTNETQKCHRAVIHNEELQYRLKQNSEKYNALVAELSKTEYMSCSKLSLSTSQDNNDLTVNSSSLISSTNTPQRVNGSGGALIPGFQIEENDESPPGSPIIKGVVKKSDSVSWVLQMDDESPEIVASRMVKRAGSFRSSLNEKQLQNAKRQLSLPSGPITISGTSHHSSGYTVMHPLQQSSSATMINPESNHLTPQRRQHSNSESEYSSPRIRSKSVNMKGYVQRKQEKPNSNGASMKKIEALAAWKEPICSTPYARHSSKFQRISHSPPRMANVGTSASKHITENFAQVAENEYENDTHNHINGSEAVSFESLDEVKNHDRKLTRHSLLSSDAYVRQSTSSTASDLKKLKKLEPQIQESAGEAMVSGTNSEDESCSGSSDESPCQSHSISSDTNSSLSNSSNRQNLINPNTLAIEEALLIDKIANSLDGTPMEVSWSSDGADSAFPPESIV